MKARLEWTTAQIRIGPGSFTHGDRYSWTCTVVRAGETAILSGVLNFPPELRKPLRALLRAEGFTELVYDRYDGAGGVRRVAVKLA